LQLPWFKAKKDIVDPPLKNKALFAHFSQLEGCNSGIGSRAGLANNYIELRFLLNKNI